MTAVSTTLTTAGERADRSERGARVVRRTPFSRVVGVEFRKMFDTRSGFWMMAAIVITAVIATVAVIIFAPDDQISYGAFAGAVGVPMTIVLPIIAILAVTSEWSQRSGLTSFTLVPHRGRVIAAKAVAALSVGVASMVIAMVVGVVGNLLGSQLAGVPVTWDTSGVELLQIVLANVMGMALGFAVGTLLRNSPAAIVTYFVYAFVLPGLLELLANNATWFSDHRGWLDYNYAQGNLYDSAMSGTEWAHLAVTSAIWLLLPLAVGTRVVLRSEVK